MTAPTLPLEQGFATDQARAEERAAAELLGALTQPPQYVGEVFSLGYDSALAGC